MHAYICMYVQYVCIYVCMHECVYLLYVCVHLCMYEKMYAYVYVYDESPEVNDSS